MQNYTYNYYKILNVPANASPEEIRSAYRKLCKFAHPDVGGSTEAMQFLNEAYATLSNPSKKASYDAWYRDNIYSPPKQKKIILHYLDYDNGKCAVTENISSFKFDIQEYLYNGDLYGITREVDGKKQTLICSYTAYKTLEGYYTAQGLHCFVITKRGREKREFLYTSEIKNNYRKFLNIDGCPLYVKQEGEEYIAICAAEYHSLVLSATISHSAAAKKFSKIFTAVVFGLLLATGIIYSLLTDNELSDAPVKSKETAFDYNQHEMEKDYTPPEKTRPEHNSLWEYYDYSPNFFVNTEETDEDYYYYLKFVNIDTNATVQSIFIHSGEPANAYIPMGTYQLKWVSGTKWYGYEYYFLNNSAQMADDTFTFDENTEWTVTLYPVTNGNLSTETIPMDEF